MSLTEGLVALTERAVADPGPRPGTVVLTDAEIDAVAARLDQQCGDAPLWTFAYGSLIWKPAFAPAESRFAVAHGWHRRFSLELERWRGSPEQPGLMMVIERGGTCRGVAYRVADHERRARLRDLIIREAPYREYLQSIRWIEVQTETGPIRALTFWAAPKGRHIVQDMPLEHMARRIARACGHFGSNAAYLYQTVAKLDAFGIRDRNLWRLQELVAAEIRLLHPRQLAKAA